MLKFIFLFTVVPLLEFTLLFNLSQALGLMTAISLVLVTGGLGALLANQQKTAVVQRIKKSIAQGQMPADELIAGLLVLIGSVCLITPGLITDLAGLACIIPTTRAIIKSLTKSKFKQLITAGQFEFQTDNQDSPQTLDIDYPED